MHGVEHGSSGHVGEWKRGNRDLAAWLLDTNVVIYLLAGDARYSERLKALIQRARREGHVFHLTPAVVAEVVYVLEGDYFRHSPDDAVDCIERLVQAPEVVCEEKEFVLAGLVHHRGGLDFVDGYLSARASEGDTHLVTNDGDIGKRTTAKLVPW